MSGATDTAAADIIIPVHNQFEHTRTLLEGIYRYSEHPFHIYVIDNQSTDATADLDKIYSRNITVVRLEENLGWWRAVNRGIAISSHPYLVLINNDVEVSRGWLRTLIAFLDTHPRIGAVGPLSSNGSNWQCVDQVRSRLVPQIPVFFTEDLHERNRILKYHFHRTGILVEGMLSFFCAALKRRAVEASGFMDEAFAGSGDDDYCRRLRRAGYVLGLSLETYVIDHSGAAQGALCDAVCTAEPLR